MLEGGSKIGKWERKISGIIPYMIYIDSEGFWELRDGVSTRAILAQFEHVQK